MAYNDPRIDKAQVVVRREFRTEYEYVPILGGIVGFWRKIYQECAGQQIWLEVQTDIEKYDRLFINGKEFDTESLKPKNG